MSVDIFNGTSQHEYYMKLVREEVRRERERDLQEFEQVCQARLQIQRKLLLVIVQAHFPFLIKLAKAQTRQIKELSIMDEMLGKVGAAQTTEEAMDALLSWLPDDDLEE